MDPCGVGGPMSTENVDPCRVGGPMSTEMCKVRAKCVCWKQTCSCTKFRLRYLHKQKQQAKATSKSNK